MLRQRSCTSAKSSMLLPKHTAHANLWVEVFIYKQCHCLSKCPACVNVLCHCTAPSQSCKALAGDAAADRFNLRYDLCQPCSIRVWIDAAAVGFVSMLQHQGLCQHCSARGHADIAAGCLSLYACLQVLASYDVWSLNKWVDLAVLVAWIVFYRALFLCTLKLKERWST